MSQIKSELYNSFWGLVYYVNHSSVSLVSLTDITPTHHEFFMFTLSLSLILFVLGQFLMQSVGLCTTQSFIG